MPHIEDLLTTPPTSQDEGYGHGVSIDSMIVTPCVPTLGEQLSNVGTSIDAELLEIPQSDNKFNLLKRAITMVVSTTSSIEKEFEDQALESASLITLARDRMQRIQTLESLLECEKATSTEIQQSLNKANEELHQLRKEKEMNDQNYSEALEKVKEFRILYQQEQEKVKEVEAELASMKASVSKAEGLLRKNNEEIKVSESALKKQAAEVDALKARITELEKVSLIILF